MKSMKKSRHITLAIMGTALMMSGIGCGSDSLKLYDKEGNPIPKTQWKTDTGSWAELYNSDGHRMTDEEMRLASEDKYHHTSHRSGGFFFFGGGGGGSGGKSSPGGSTSSGGFGSTGGSHSAAS